jgi:hypothetical protein
MPVIGRLDRQVEEVIINPAGRRRGEGADEEPPRPTAPHGSPGATRDEAREQPPDGRREGEELPVWLL